jgi:ribose transport system ATP-binding protein
MAGAAPAFLSGTGLTKSYGAVKALSATDFHWARGEVIGLIGHNGAGKSTLINVLTGTVERTDGTMMLYGMPLSRWNAVAAQKAGLRCVFQELSLCPNLTAAENTRVLHRSLQGWGWHARAVAAIRSALDAVFPGHGIPLDIAVAELPIGQRQMIEIARAFSETDMPVRGVILDEPTSSLGPEATQQLLGHVARAAQAGIACVLITHRLNEVLAVADRVVIMKDGAVASDFVNEGMTRSALVASMGTVEPAKRVQGALTSRGAELVRHDGKDAEDAVISLCAGEILGFAGLDGHGQRERLRTIFDTSVAKGAAIAFVAGDRVVEGVFPLWSIRENLIHRSLKQLSKAGLLNGAQGDALARTWFDKLGVRAPGIHVPLVSLSGGNQQKVLFARALASDAAVIILDDPMRGVDVGTKQEVYALIRAEAERGRAFIWYSTEIEELENCDRVLVFREGRAVTLLEGADIEHNAIIDASFGTGKGATHA